jgi:hypothetical protein
LEGTVGLIFMELRKVDESNEKVPGGVNEACLAVLGIIQKELRKSCQES